VITVLPGKFSPTSTTLIGDVSAVLEALSAGMQTVAECESRISTQYGALQSDSFEKVRRGLTALFAAGLITMEGDKIVRTQIA
jgi:hypothetical protein